MFTNTNFQKLTTYLFGFSILFGFFSPIPQSVHAAPPNYPNYDLRYVAIEPGNIAMTGNSSGISLTQEDARRQSRQVEFDSIGVFTSLDNTKQVPGYPPGTTRNWQENESSAQLNIPDNSEILFAVLTWGGGYRWDDGTTVNQLNEILSPVTLTTPSGVHTVTPTEEFSYKRHQAESGFVRWLYSNSVDVTEFVKPAGGGNYSVKGIPAQLNFNPIGSTNPDNAAGWTLITAYKNNNETVKNLSIFTGSQISNGNPAQISGFGTPPNGNLEGYIWVSAMEGDGGLTGDQLKFGRNIDSLAPVSTPDNPIGNFFQSRINGSNGQVNTSGSFGSSNSPLGRSTPLSRQGWDITTVNISDLIDNNQTEAVIQGTSQGDTYYITTLGLGIEVFAPRVINTITVDKPITTLGDTLTYTITVTNTGTNEALDVNTTSRIPLGTSFIPGSIQSDDDFNGFNPESGIIFDSIQPGESKVYSYQVRVDSIPETLDYKNEAETNFEFIMAAGQPANQGSTTSNRVITTIQQLPIIEEPIEDPQIPPDDSDDVPNDDNTNENADNQTPTDQTNQNQPPKEEIIVRQPQPIPVPNSGTTNTNSNNSISLPRTGGMYVFWLTLVLVIGCTVSFGSSTIGIIEEDDSDYQSAFY